jgi:hypothetical protein
VLSAEKIEMFAWALGAYLIIGALVSVLLMMGLDFTMKNAPDRLSKDGHEFMETTPKREVVSFICVAWPLLFCSMAVAFLQRIRKRP